MLIAPLSCRAVYVAIPVCVAGVILITQPPFLGRDSQQRSKLGIMLAVGQVRLGSKTCTHVTVCLLKHDPIYTVQICIVHVSTACDLPATCAWSAGIGMNALCRTGPYVSVCVCLLATCAQAASLHAGYFLSLCKNVCKRAAQNGHSQRLRLLLVPVLNNWSHNRVEYQHDMGLGAGPDAAPCMGLGPVCRHW